MNATLASTIDAATYTDPSIYEKFFSKKDQDDLKQFTPRETTPIGIPGKSCESNLFLGFLFDGTRNNYALSEKAGDNTHSNVARLFDAYPGQTIAPAIMLTPQIKWPDESRYPNYFRIYTPGVGTPFEEVRDNGEGFDRTLGAAMAKWGERRLCWALAQAINALHRYFHKAPLLTNADIMELINNLNLDASSLKSHPIFIDLGRAANTKAFLKQALYRLHGALRYNMPDKMTGQPAKVDPGVLRTIYASTFGFSRGAAAARAFTNWFVALCELDAEMLGRSGLTLGGFPMAFDYLGVFDTVASVGFASSTLIADGHGAWADAEVSLRIPSGVKCTHLVSAHEVRRSFPLDSISVGGALADGCKEIVFPGVHSDVGGGYMPKEQGRGNDPLGADLLSRIPLAVMYREARLNGVPLKLERSRQLVKDRFKIATSTLNAFNAYIAASPKTSNSLRDIMRSQMKLAILWRKSWAGRMAALPSVQRAEQVDSNDIASADNEFVAEIKHFEQWRKHPTQTREYCPNPVIGVCIEVEESLIPGYDPERFTEWQAINQYWIEAAVVPAVAYLLENLVHDSRAWFKLTGWEAGEVEAGLRAWSRKYDELKARGINPRNTLEPSVPFTPTELDWIEEYKKTGRIPKMKTQGREPFELGAGYLRFRRVYAGGDQIRLTRKNPPSNNVELGEAEVVSV